MPGDGSVWAFDPVGMIRYPNQTKPLEPADTAARRTSVLATLTVAVVVASPQLVTVSRAVANLPVSAVAVAWGRTHGGTCDVHGDLTVTCESMHGGYANGGTTVGNVWLYGDLGGIDRHRHESRHSDQWAVFGPAFPALYGAECARTGGDYHRNVFEQWAGLHDGGYLR
jgi:hypothetical protein